MFPGRGWRGALFPVDPSESQVVQVGAAANVAGAAILCLAVVNTSYRQTLELYTVP